MRNRNDMVGISPKIIEQYGLGNSEWELSQYTFVNPTNSPITISPFNPQISNTFNYPTSPVSLSGSIPSVYTPITTAPQRGQSVAYDNVNNKLWAGAFLGNSIYSYDDNPPQTSPATFNSLALASQLNIRTISFSQTSVRIAIGSSTGFVTVVDSTTETHVADIAIGFLGVNWIEWNSLNNTWVVSTSSNFIVVIDCATLLITATIPLGVGVTPERIAINTANNMAYIADSTLGNDQIFKINLTTNTVVLVIPTNLQISEPFSVGINPTTNKMYVSSLVNLGIWTFDLGTDTFISNISPTKKSSDFLVHTPSNTVYGVTQLGSGELLLFNGTTDALESIISFTQLIDRITLAYSSLNNIVYASAFTIPFQVSSFIAPQTPTLYITGSGSSSYNDDVRDFFYNPAWVRKIFIFSDNDTNFNQIYSLVTKDANGNECKSPQNANISVGTMQFQNRIGVLDYPNKECILGINQWFEGLIIQPNSQYTMILAFQQLKKSDLLSAYPLNSGNSIRDLADISTINPIPKYSMDDLDVIMPLNSGVRQNIDVIEPFSISEFNESLIQESKRISNVGNLEN